MGFKIMGKKASRIGKPKVIFVSPGLLEPATRRAGGIEEIDYRVGKELSRNGYLVSILGPFLQKWSESLEIENGLIIRYLRFPALASYPPRKNGELIYTTFLLEPLASILCFISLLHPRRNKNAILIVHNGSIGFSATIAGKLNSMKILFSEGNIYPWESNKGLGRKEKLTQKVGFIINFTLGKTIANMADLIRVQSKGIEANFVKTGIDQKRIEVISAGVNTNEITPRVIPGFKKNPIIGFIGRLTPEKGVSLLLDVIKDAELKIPNARFLILGDGPFIKEFEIFNNVIHIGAVPKDQINNWLAKIDIILFFQKDIGLAEIEAMSAGKAIIACNLVSTEGVLINEYNSLLCEPDSGSYLSAIERLLANQKLCNDISNNARGNAVEYFDWEIIGNKWTYLLERINI
jgi:glycosyltransferase involved in cell wall biosynthesis